MEFKNGDIVRLRPEWCTPNERKHLYSVVNVNDYTRRCKIQCLTCDMVIKPVELVGFEMIEQTGFNAEEWRENHAEV